MTKLYAKLPPEVSNLLISFQAWLVGSGVDWVLGGGKDPRPRDLDVVIPPKHWQAACRSLKTPVTINTFGGLKTVLPCGMELDLWPSHIEDYITPETGAALRLEPRVLITPHRV